MAGIGLVCDNEEKVNVSRPGNIFYLIQKSLCCFSR